MGLSNCVHRTRGLVFHYALAPGCTSHGPCSRWAWRPLQNALQELSHYFFSFTDTFVLSCFFLVGAYWCLDVLRPCQDEKREFTICGTLLSHRPSQTVHDASQMKLTNTNSKLHIIRPNILVLVGPGDISLLLAEAKLRK